MTEELVMEQLVTNMPRLKSPLEIVQELLKVSMLEYIEIVTLVQMINCTFSLWCTRSGVSASGILLSGMWVVASKVFRRQPLVGETAVNSIEERWCPANSASRSVCPG